MQNGILPTDFYESSMSDFIKAQNAKSPEEMKEQELVDPLQLAISAGLA